MKMLKFHKDKTQRCGPFLYGFQCHPQMHLFSDLSLSLKQKWQGVNLVHTILLIRDLHFFTVVTYSQFCFTHISEYYTV